ncbi:MAG: hypothetical protein D6743_17460 [Calditrichaeota bacterium]|nr:MAG: hypothetical protein D6743_17460 [Calditrichota bacterium]
MSAHLETSLLEIWLVFLLVVAGCGRQGPEGAGGRKPAAPELQLLGTPDVIAVVLADDSSSAVNKAGASAPSSVALGSQPYVTMTTRLAVTNVGETKARLLLFVTTDTLRELNQLRAFLCGSNTRLDVRYRLHFPPLGESMELPPHGKGALDLDLRHTVRFVSGKRFALHYLLVYRDRSGQIYDATFRADFRFRDVRHPQVLAFKEKDIFDRPFLERKLSVTALEKDIACLGASAPVFFRYNCRRATELSRVLAKLRTVLHEE